MSLRTTHGFHFTCVLLTLAVAALIVFQSSQPRDTSGVLSLTTNEAYAGHFAIYAVMTFTALLGLGSRTLPAIATVLVLAAGLGLGLELYQAYIPSRSASSMDALANTSGAVFGALLYLMLTTGARLFSRPFVALRGRLGPRWARP